MALTRLLQEIESNLIILIDLLNIKMRNLKPILFLLFCLSINFTANSQILLKNYLSPEEYASYSKSIDLFQNEINNNSDSITYFVGPNYDLERLGELNNKLIFDDHSLEQTNIFISNHSIKSIISKNYLDSFFSENLEKNKLVLASGKVIYFQKNENSYLISDQFKPELVEAESIITKSILINGKYAIHLLEGIIRY